MRTNEAAPEVTPKLRSDYAPPAYAARTIDLAFELAEDGALVTAVTRFEGGPAADPRYIWRPSAILAATDPVALDTIGTQMIDRKRTEQNLPTLEAAGRMPKQLASAAARGVGTNDPAKIDVLKRTV